MWISNTATAVMMLPIAMSIIQLIQKENESLTKQKGFKNFAFALMLGIAYAANIGGVITIIGTPPNVVLVGLMQEIYGYTLDFNRWLLIGLPITLFLTELMSNVALVTIFIPVVMGIANGLGEEVLIFVIPVTMASSFAFMLPISTPPNAILFSSGFINIKEMMKVGIWFNLISILLLWLSAFTLIKWVF